MTSTTTPATTTTPSGPARPEIAATLLTTPIVTSSLGPLAAPAGGTGTVPPAQLAAQAAAASTVLGLVPHDVAVTSQLTLDQLIAIIHERLAQLEAMQMLTSADVQHTVHTITARRTGKPPMPRPGAPAPGHREVSVAGIVHQVAAGTPVADGEFSFHSFLGDLLDLAATVLGGVGGGLIGGPAGAVMGAMTAHEWMQAQDF